MARRIVIDMTSMMILRTLKGFIFLWFLCVIVKIGNLEYFARTLV